MKTGIYYYISNEDYHNGEGISKSNLDDIAKCPAIYQWRKSAPEDQEKKKALDIGTALHCLLLEPDEFDKQFIVPEPINRRTNAGKAEYKKIVESANIKKQIFITSEEKNKLLLMRDSAFAHPDAKKLLNMDGHCESSIYWTDFETNVLCRIRPDKLIKDKPIIVDVKKTGNINDFGRSIEDYRYHVQAAMYIDGYIEVFDVDPVFLFIVVSEVIDCGKYPVRVFQLDSHDLSIGYQLYRENLITYADCMKNNKWDGIETIQRPYWTRRKENE